MAFNSKPWSLSDEKINGKPELIHNWKKSHSTSVFSPYFAIQMSQLHWPMSNQRKRITRAGTINPVHAV